MDWRELCGVLTFHNGAQIADGKVNQALLFVCLTKLN